MRIILEWNIKIWIKVDKDCNLYKFDYDSINSDSHLRQKLVAQVSRKDHNWLKIATPLIIFQAIRRSFRIENSQLKY